MTDDDERGWCFQRRVADHVACHQRKQQQQQQQQQGGCRRCSRPAGECNRASRINFQSETSFEMQSIYVTTRFQPLGWRAGFVFHLPSSVRRRRRCSRASGNISRKLPATIRWSQYNHVQYAGDVVFISSDSVSRAWCYLHHTSPDAILSFLGVCLETYHQMAIQYHRC